MAMSLGVGVVQVVQGQAGVVADQDACAVVPEAHSAGLEPVPRLDPMPRCSFARR